jgi:hypothetical protein
VVVVSRLNLPAWCERRDNIQPDGRYVVACYYTHDGHPVTRARAERIELIEYAPDGTPLRFQEGVVDAIETAPLDEISFSSAGFQFSR